MEAGYGTKNLQSPAEELQLPNKGVPHLTVQRHCFELVPKQSGQDQGSPDYQSAHTSTAMLIKPSSKWEEKGHEKEALNSNSLEKKRKEELIQKEKVCRENRKFYE